MPTPGRRPRKYKHRSLADMTVYEDTQTKHLQAFISDSLAIWAKLSSNSQEIHLSLPPKFWLKTWTTIPSPQFLKQFSVFKTAMPKMFGTGKGGSFCQINNLKFLITDLMDVIKIKNSMMGLKIPLIPEWGGWGEHMWVKGNIQNEAGR